MCIRDSDPVEEGVLGPIAPALLLRGKRIEAGRVHVGHVPPAVPLDELAEILGETGAVIDQAGGRGERCV